jgi:hypothetical protein
MKQRLLDDKWMLGLGGGFVVALLFSAISLKTITGIPAHPLLLHVPVVLIPSLAIAAIVFAVKSEWRERYDIAYGIGAIVTMASTIVTANAGENWEHMLSGPRRMAIHDHAELGDKLKVVVVVFAALIMIQIVIDRGIVEGLSARFSNTRGGLAVGLSVLIAAVAIGAGVLTVIVGHEGAKVAFKDQAGGPARGQFPGQFYPGKN